MKKAKKPTFSPDISPINGNLQETLRDSRLENEHHWMDKPYPDGMLSTTETITDMTTSSKHHELSWNA